MALIRGHHKGLQASHRGAALLMKERGTQMLNVRETAEALGVHENTIRNWERKGILKAIRLPGSNFRRFPREDVERMRAEMMRSYAPAVEMPETSNVSGFEKVAD